MIEIIIYLFILLIFYGSVYIILQWNGETIKAYLQLNEIFKQKPAILIGSRGGGCIWKNIIYEPYVRQFCLTDGHEDSESSRLHMSIDIKLFAGYGNINITKKAYDKRMSELLALPRVSYNPRARCLYISGCDGGDGIGICEMFELACKVAQKTEAFTQTSNISPRDKLRCYYYKYFRT